MPKRRRTWKRFFKRRTWRKKGSTKYRRTWKKSSKTSGYKKYKSGTKGAKKAIKTFDASTKGLVNFGRELYPRLALVHLPYYDYITLVNDVTEDTTYSEYQFRLTSLYDPDLTGTGHQPRGYDQLSTIYTGYLVLGVKYDIELVYNTDADSGGVAMNLGHGLVIGPGDYPAQFNTWASFMETPASKYIQHRTTFMQGTAPSSSNAQYLGVSAQRDKTTRYQGYVDIRNMLKYWGSMGSTSAPSTFSFDWPDAFMVPVTGSPATVSLMTFVVASLSQATGTGGAPETNSLGTCYLQVRLVYDAIMMGQVFPAAS